MNASSIDLVELYDVKIIKRIRGVELVAFESRVEVDLPYAA